MTLRDAQAALIARGYDLGHSGVDGHAGAKTTAVIIAFRRASGLYQDGIAGPKTWAFLQLEPVADLNRRRPVSLPALLAWRF